MKELVDKLTTYNLFNFLLPGIVFAVLAEGFLSRSFIHKDIVIGVFLYYFMGMVMSRIGSLVMEPVLKIFGLKPFEKYPDQIRAEKKDEKVGLFLELTNSYRTLCALFLTLIILKLYELLEGASDVLKSLTPIIFVVVLFFIFMFAFRKQNAYLKMRIKEAEEPQL